MKIDLDGLKKLFQAYVTSNEPAGRTECPTAQAMAQSFEPSASAYKKKQIVDHLSKCSFCQNEFTILFEMHRIDASLEAEESPRLDKLQRPSAEVRIWLSSAILQCVLIFLGLGLAIYSTLLIDHQREIMDIQRSLKPGIALLSPISNKAPTGPLVFRWKTKINPEYYTLDLFDEALLPVWTSDKIYGDHVSLPSAIHVKLDPGRSYYWMVTAFIHDLRVEESSLGRFFIPK